MSGNQEGYVPSKLNVFKVTGIMSSSREKMLKSPHWFDLVPLYTEFSILKTFYFVGSTELSVL